MSDSNVSQAPAVTEQKSGGRGRANTTPNHRFPDMLIERSEDGTQGRYLRKWNDENGARKTEIGQWEPLRTSGRGRSAVDTPSVILTGRAIKREGSPNAQYLWPYNDGEGNRRVALVNHFVNDDGEFDTEILDRDYVDSSNSSDDE